MHAGCADGWTYLTGLDETLELLESVSSPQVALALDAYHLGHEAGLLARIPQIVARIAVVQLGDARGPPRGEQNRCRLGDGELPLREIVRALATSGYDGYYEIELLGEDVERVDYHELIDHSQRVCRGWLSDVR
jgi:sugar phosphate isomerase/epimerase